jgi:hypothetical protein
VAGRAPGFDDANPFPEGIPPMSSKILRTAGVIAALAALGGAQVIGPSTSTPPYTIPNPALPTGSVQTVSLLTTGDSIGGYRLVGIPDGLGAFQSGGTLTILSNHELGATQGIMRAHGSAGAFVSRWEMTPGKSVLSGRDHNTAPLDVYSFNRLTNTWNAGTFAWERFCSADLPPQSAFQFGGLGTAARILLNGEEIRPPGSARHGYAWAHLVSGAGLNQTWELPHLGQCSFENVVASPFPQPKTIVMCLDDSSAVTNPAIETQPSEVYVYVGNKQAAGDDITKAGLTGGILHGVRVSVGGVVVGGESNANGLGTGSYAGSGTFELVALGDASTFNGATQQTMSIAANVFRMQRVEDGAWDPRPGHENDFYFVTTASTTTNSRLWRLRFTAIAQPELGGQIDIILNGSEGQLMFDNLCVDSYGRVFMTEDPGSATQLAKTWMYDTTNGRLIEVGRHDPAYFSPGSPGFLTTNEEASGIIPAFDLLGDGWYLFSEQNHASSIDPELVEGGQLIAMWVDPELGHELALWFTSPLGSGSIQSHLMFGSPGGAFFTPVSLAAGTFPNGAFFGLDIPFSDLVAQFLAGAPFQSTLDAQGRFNSATFSPIMPGLTLFSVALDDVLVPFPAVSAPVQYTIP